MKDQPRPVKHSGILAALFVVSCGASPTSRGVLPLESGVGSDAGAEARVSLALDASLGIDVSEDRPADMRTEAGERLDSAPAPVDAGRPVFLDAPVVDAGPRADSPSFDGRSVDAGADVVCPRPQGGAYCYPPGARCSGCVCVGYFPGSLWQCF